MEKLSITSNTTAQNTTENPNITPSKWTHLPKDILTTLLKYIDLQTDLPRIRGVCPSWRSALPVNLNLPSRLPVPPLEDGEEDDESGPSPVLAECRLYLITPLDGNGKPWLARMINVGPGNGKWHLLNPFNLQDYFISHPSVNGEISLLDCNVVEVAKPWSLIGVGYRGKTDTISKKVVGGWNVQADYIFAVLVQLEVVSRRGEGELVFKRICDKEWVRIEETFGDNEDAELRMLDIAYHDGKFYAFELTKWKVGVIDPDKSSISMEFMDTTPGVLGEPIDDCHSVLIDGCSYIVGDVYLVPSKEHVYLVIELSTLPSKNAKLMVFVLKEGRWERVMSLGDVTLFIGYDVSFAVSNLVNWKRGSICRFPWPFPMIYDASGSAYQGSPKVAECIEMMSFPEYWRYLSMYNMEEEEKGIVGFEDLKSIEVYTGLFFPPPAWDLKI